MTSLGIPKTHWIWTCRACGKPCELVDNRAVIHEWPMCLAFLMMHPEEFLETHLSDMRDSETGLPVADFVAPKAKT